MQLTPIPYDRPRVFETFALRGVAVLLAPVMFTGMLAVAAASLPAAAFRRVLSRVGPSRDDVPRGGGMGDVAPFS